MEKSIVKTTYFLYYFIVFPIFKKKFNPKEVAIALISFYPKWYRGRLKSISHTDKIRGDVALEFIQKASDLGYQVVVVDGKSSKSFRKELAKLPVTKILKKNSHKRSPAKRQAFKVASKLPGVRVIVGTEAEKISLLDSMEVISQPVLKNQIDVVVPKREDTLFKETYPDYMYELEVEGNRLSNKQLKLYNLLPEEAEDLDLFFGPRVFRNNPKILSLFLKKFQFKEIGQFLNEYFDPEEIANAQYFPIVVALKKKLKVKSIQVPFSYPELQKMNETKGARDFFEEKRKAQRVGFLLTLMYLLNYLKKK